MENLNPPAIVGEAVAGQAAKVRSQINSIIKGVNTSTFDLAELLHEVKTKAYYAPEFETFGQYAESLEMKPSKSYYLVRIVENMGVAGIPRTEYEKVGIAKLRAISKIEPTDPGAAEKIKALVSGAASMDLEEVNQSVAESKGLTGDDAMVWMNITLKKAARDEVIKPALALAKKNIGTVGKDSEGMAVDASDGAALEMVCADFLSDPNNGYDTDALNKDEAQLKGSLDV